MIFFSPTFRALTAMTLMTLSAMPLSVACAQDEETSYIETGDYTYKVVLDGLPKSMNEKDTLALTEAHKQKENPPPTVYLLQKRLDADAQTLVKALQSEGYYDAIVTADINRAESPYVARFAITPGDVYMLQSVRFLLNEKSETPEILLPAPRDIDMEIGGTVNYQKLLDARQRLRKRIHQLNCLRTLRVRTHLRVDTATKKAEAIYRINAGKEAKFGSLTVEGLETVEMPYIDRKIPWKEGECFKPTQVEDLQVNLLQTNLFASSDITVEEEPDADGEVDITLKLRERKHRTIKAGIGFATEEGLDFKPSWEHRNFFGEGEKLTVESTLSTFLQSIGAKLERPDFMQKNQTLILEGTIAQSETDAYDSMSISTQARVSRPLAENLTGGIGIGYALKQVDDEGVSMGEETFSLLSFPAYLEHNTRDSDIDPTKGHNLRLDMEPFIETLNTGDVFLKSQATAKWYYQHEPLLFKPTWAFRASIGSIMGSANGDIPADERFYSGGGGSVRGYAYQLLGPLQNGSPTGGRSLVEFSGELRLRVSESIGVVPFVDAGNVYPEIYPAFDGDLFYAAGLGLRYYSSFGPFRFDFAVPLDKRQNVDDPYQFYLSFGQSF
jgi:translocation and assembly module TamA